MRSRNQRDRLPASSRLSNRQNKADCQGIKFSVEEDGQEVGRAYLYIMRNQLHQEPFGLLEDVFIDENLRGKGIGTKLLKEVFREARASGCYKLIATSRHSRPKVHKLYERLGFKNRGIEFRMDF